MAAQFLTPRQVGERWAMSARHVSRLCKSGALRAMRSGSDWRVAEADVLAYELAHTSGPAEPAQQQSATAPKPKEGRAPAVVDSFTLPADYTPCFPSLWPGHEPQTKKTSPVRR